MADHLSQAGRSRNMSAIRAFNTAPERALRQAVWHMGARFRIHPKDLPGRPDLVSRRAKLAVFVDGCFWHGCPMHYVAPTTRPGYWRKKVAGNRQRRDRVRSAYGPDWLVI